VPGAGRGPGRCHGSDIAGATTGRIGYHHADLFVGLAMIESLAIYCFVVSMILIFANPFWTNAIAQAGGK
jgi:F0F1-type ATP synthase membrane subunit c/vacuolar-type H+-ATPase subunit K